MIEENQAKRFAAFFSEYVAGVAEEWMCIIDLDEDVFQPGDPASQARVTWAGDGSFKVGESPYGEELGHYRLIITVEPITVLPIGPENDPAQIEELDEPEPLEWVSATWGATLQGDRVRIGAAEAQVVGFSELDWHANDDAWHPAPFPHTNVHVRLAGRSDLLTFPPSAKVEILCSVTRKAMLALGGTFPE